MKRCDFTTPYMRAIKSNATELQLAVESIVHKNQILPVGHGFIDLITNMSAVVKSITELAELGIIVEKATWWTLESEANKERCSRNHAGGGPKNIFGSGHFSECYKYPPFSVEDHGIDVFDVSISPQVLLRNASRVTVTYFLDDLKNENFYCPCLHPGLWLLVPDDWKRTNYKV